MALFGNLREYDPDDDDWTEYFEQMENFFLANDITQDSKKRAIFLSSCGGKTYSLIRTLCTPNKPAEKTFVEIIDAIKVHQSPKSSVITERYKFNSRVRKENETVSQYVAILHKISQHCDYGEICDEMIRDRLICGIQNDFIQQRLLAEPTLTLDAAVKIASSMETVTRNLNSVVKKREFNIPIPDKEDPPKVEPNYNDNITCFRCGARYSVDANGFEDKECHYCHKKGRIARILLPTSGNEDTVVQRSRRDKKAPLYLKDYKALSAEEDEESDLGRPRRDKKTPTYLEDYAA